VFFFLISKYQIDADVAARGWLLRNPQSPKSVLNSGQIPAADDPQNSGKLDTSEIETPYAPAAGP
jgi:hypothetical protein